MLVICVPRNTIQNKDWNLTSMGYTYTRNPINALIVIFAVLIEAMLKTTYEQAMRLLNILVLIPCATISHPIKATWINIFGTYIQKLAIL